MPRLSNLHMMAALPRPSPRERASSTYNSFGSQRYAFFSPSSSGPSRESHTNQHPTFFQKMIWPIDTTTTSPRCRWANLSTWHRCSPGSSTLHHHRHHRRMTSCTRYTPRSTTSCSPGIGAPINIKNACSRASSPPPPLHHTRMARSTI